MAIINVFGEDSQLSGRVSGHDFTILGRFEGELTATGRLHIGPAAVVKAQIQAAVVEVDGDFDGEIRSDLLRFGAKARARGLFLAERLSLRDGALVDGAINPPPSPSVQEDESAAVTEAGPPSLRPRSPTWRGRRSDGRLRSGRRAGRASARSSASGRPKGHGTRLRVAVPARRSAARLR